MYVGTDQKWAEENEGDKVDVGEGGAAGLVLVLNHLDAQGLIEGHLKSTDTIIKSMMTCE